MELEQDLRIELNIRDWGHNVKWGSGGKPRNGVFIFGIKMK